ncbi:MAG: bifunctional folylpolyglutamate synthase/dihydrofolate synthase [Actinomycetota bacterium]|nr:bifunctional folylpolyglutamate synthase/dihydrofolate synthase [Actinomycetota bacterium]
MSFEEATAYLDALGIDAMKKMAPSLHRIEALCAAMNHPERAVPVLHITGTNGKTSTARIASSLLVATGLTVGTYTSPHLETVRERLTLNADAISEDDFSEVWDHLLPYARSVEDRLEEKLTYFELLTAMYFLWAAEAPVDASVVEVGLGGTWDATNVVSAPVAVITNVARDHTELLGEDLLTIAGEKVGIIDEDAAVVTGERSPGVLQLIRDTAEAKNASVSALGVHFSISTNKMALGGRFLSIKTSAAGYDGLFLPLHGAHQGANAAVALEAITGFLPARELAPEVVAEGFGRAVVPGRLETVKPNRESAAQVVLDVAHNPDGMSALVTSLVETFPFERVLFVVGILTGKDYEGMLREMARIPCRLLVTRPQNARAIEVDELERAATSLGLDASAAGDVSTAIDAALHVATSDDLICITGSHYVVGEARTFLLGGNE